MRNILFARILIVLVTISIAAVIVSPMATAKVDTVDYADWLLSHLPESDLPNVREAAQQASASGARSFDDYLRSFSAQLRELEGSAGQEEIGTPEEGTEKLVQELRFLFTRFVGDGILARQMSTAALDANQTPSVARVSEAAAYRARDTAPSGVLARHRGECADAATLRYFRSSLQPLGP